MTGRWTLDRRVPIPLIISLGIYALVQASATGYWVANVNGRMENVEQKVMSLVTLSERTIRLETNMDNVLASLKEIKDILRQQPRAP